MIRSITQKSRPLFGFWSMFSDPGALRAKKGQEMISPENMEKRNSEPKSPSDWSRHSVVTAPLPDEDRFPVPWELMTGARREELIAERYGEARWIGLDNIDVNHFGTMKNPIQVPSFNPERIVACEGAQDFGHPVVYFELKYPENPVWVCELCECWYELVPQLTWETVEP